MVEPHTRRRLRRLAVTLVVLAAMVTPLVIYAQPLTTAAIVGAAAIDTRVEHIKPLRIPSLPSRSTLLAADGSVLATFYTQDRLPVALKQVSPTLIDALLSSEDRTFFSNPGIDARGIIRAGISNLLGNSRQGGSTITQQYAKNLLEIEGVRTATAGTLSRKLHEVVYARQLTKRLTKDQILEGYLNTVYFGAGAYGIGAAAQRYFSTTPADLSVPQAALLVALVRSPDSYNPLTHREAALVERNAVLATEVANHKLTPAAARAAAGSPLVLVPSTPSNGCVTSPYPYFCDWVRSTLDTLPELGATPAIRASRLAAGGLTITTTLDPKLQTDAQLAVVSQIPVIDRVGTAMVMVDPTTGSVRAMAQNRAYGFDAAQGQTSVNYTTSASPVGSTFKAFTLAAALSSGVPLSTILPAGSTYHSPTLDNPPSGAYQNAEPYSPSNIDLATATALSVNTAFVQLEEKVGVENVAAIAHKMGLTSLPLSGPGAPAPNEGTLTLGARGFSPLEMASAYATLANAGTHCHPVGVHAITDATGQSVAVAPRCTPVLDPAVAATVTSLLSGVVLNGTGTGAAVVGHPLVGKTGTTSNFGSAWFVGYTPKLVTATWMGDPRGASYPLMNVAGVSEVFGGTLPAAEFARAMSSALASDPAWIIPPANEAYLAQPQNRIPDVTGLSADLATLRLRSLGAVVVGATSGTVTSTSPPAGSLLAPGESVTLEQSAW